MARYRTDGVGCKRSKTLYKSVACAVGCPVAPSHPYRYGSPRRRSPHPLRATPPTRRGSHQVNLPRAVPNPVGQPPPPQRRVNVGHGRARRRRPPHGGWEDRKRAAADAPLDPLGQPVPRLHVRGAGEDDQPHRRVRGQHLRRRLGHVLIPQRLRLIVVAKHLEVKAAALGAAPPPMVRAAAHGAHLGGKARKVGATPQVHFRQVGHHRRGEAVEPPARDRRDERRRRVEADHPHPVRAAVAEEGGVERRGVPPRVRPVGEGEEAWEADAAANVRVEVGRVLPVELFQADDDGAAGGGGRAGRRGGRGGQVVQRADDVELDAVVRRVRVCFPDNDQAVDEGGVAGGGGGPRGRASAAD